jgi:hypothetical protein
MGHTRLGEVPKTHKWSELVDRISGSGRTGNVATADVSIGVIAAQTLDATQKSLKRAATDPGVRYTFYLITQVFAFIPREWPYLWERLIVPAGQQPATPFPELARASLIHQDIVTYSQGLLVKVQTVIASAMVIMNEVYEQFRNLPENQLALMQLRDNFEKYDFENFVGA